MAQSSPGAPASPPAEESSAPRPQRSPAERVLVWGGILVLLVLVGMQARARLGYNKTLEALQDRMAEDEGPDGRPLPVNDMHNYIYGWPARTTQEKSQHLSTVQLTWSGLPMTKPLVMVVSIDPEEDKENGGTVMGLETSGFVEAEQPTAPAPATTAEPATAQ